MALGVGLGVGVGVDVGFDSAWSVLSWDGARALAVSTTGISKLAEIPEQASPRPNSSSAFLMATLSMTPSSSDGRFIHSNYGVGYAGVFRRLDALARGCIG